jgi:hypothetical protein
VFLEERGGKVFQVFNQVLSDRAQFMVKSKLFLSRFVVLAK